MTTGLIIGAVVLVVIIILIWFLSAYNSLVRLKNQIEKAWSNIEAALQQRHDELTKLVDSVKGYMKHEKETLNMVVQARNAFASAKTVKEKAKADKMMESAVRSVFAVVESYPNLKANENVTQLMNRISDIENILADRREFYNDSVYSFNTRIEQIPYVFIANMLHYTRKEPFKAEEEAKKDVKIEF
ncbi:MAG: LemA family protein [Candidatus Woesearchaeota archaeon]